MTDLLSQVRPILTTTLERWQAMARSVPADLLALKPAPGEWSAVECLQHMVDTERVFHSRVRAFMEGRDFSAFNPDAEGTQSAAPSMASLVEEFARLRAETLRLFETITPTDLERTARHAELGPVTLRMMINEWATHDFNHTIQAERAMMQPFLRDCGPWQKYFTEHFITA